MIVLVCLTGDPLREQASTLTINATGRVLARISKMPVQNSNFKIYARPDLATNLLQILVPAKVNSLVCQKDNLHFSYVLEDGLLGNYWVITVKPIIIALLLISRISR